MWTIKEVDFPSILGRFCSRSVVCQKLHSQGNGNTHAYIYWWGEGNNNPHPHPPSQPIRQLYNKNLFNSKLGQ